MRPAAPPRNLPLRRAAQNRVWLEIVQIALAVEAHRWELKRLRLRMSAAEQLATTGGQRYLRLAQH